MIEDCYLCGGSRTTERWPRVRDRVDVSVRECCACGLVFLSSTDQVSGDFYGSSQMHGGAVDLEAWRRETSADDERRLAYCRAAITNTRLLDFGCGNGGFLMRAREVAASVCGVEVEREAAARLRQDGLDVAGRLEEVTGEFDVITLFHVLEHLKDPRRMVQELADRLRRDGRLVIEVPNADDALLQLYGVDAFKSFTYWSCHLFLFTASTLSTLLGQAGATNVHVDHLQRYPLSNHLYWLTHSQPGGHCTWSFLDSPALTQAYGARLAALGMTDTLIADARIQR